jgi:hypothetical protein
MKEIKPGEVFKYKWVFSKTNVDLVYYMILDKSYVNDKGNIMYLTTTLVNLNRQGNPRVPYSKNSIYYTRDEKQGSQRSGYWEISEDSEFKNELILSSIDENDKKKLINIFNKNSRQLDYLKEINEDEGVVPEFLKYLI